jgi:hypothetical protein
VVCNLLAPTPQSSLGAWSQHTRQIEELLHDRNEDTVREESPQVHDEVFRKLRASASRIPAGEHLRQGFSFLPGPI